MNVRMFALILGIVFTIVGLAGLTGMQNLNHPYTGPALSVHQQESDLLGLFHVNILHNIVHLLFGIAGIAVYFVDIMAARAYAQIVGVLYLVLAILGLIPPLHSTFGLIPIDGNDIWLHGLIAVVALYFGFAAPAATVRSGYDQPDTTTPANPAV